MKTQKPFPWKCGNCGNRSVVPATIRYSIDMEHDGRTYSVTVDDLAAPRCERCGEVVLDDAANHRISDAFRQQIGLLTPQEIRGNRERLEKTQRELAAALGIAEATLSRWETGAQIQQRVMDRFLRLYFAFSNVRDALADEEQIKALGATVQHRSQALTPESMIEFREAALAAFQQAIRLP
jgi:putative zinc finger/helix-turn-helix YgiT family protein